MIVTINVNIHASTCATSGLSPPESPSTSPSSSASNASWVYPPVLRDSSDSGNENNTDDHDGDDDDDSSVSGEGGQQQLPLSSFFGDTTMVTTGALGSERTSDEDSDGYEAEDNIVYLPISRGTVFRFQGRDS